METEKIQENSVEVIEPRLYAGAVADEIVASVNEAITEYGQASLVMAGGKTPGSIYRQLALPPRVDEIDWSKVSIYLGDERWVPHTDGMSNYKMVHDTLLVHLGNRTPKVYPVDTSLETAEKSAEAYEELIRKNVPSENGTPIFDVVLLGVGEDGHTASLFPGSPLVTRSGGVCFPNKHPIDGGWRTTLSPDALFSARRILFLVKGENKAEIIKRVLEQNDDPSVIPAALFRRAQQRTAWFLDSGAAQRLEKKAS